jgi:hypothetical protein
VKRRPNGRRQTRVEAVQVWAIRFWLDHERLLPDRAMFDLAIDSKLRGCNVVKVKIGDLVSGGLIRSRAIVIQQTTGQPVQLNSSNRRAAAFWPGSNAEAEQSMSSLFRAGSITPTISAPGNMPISLTSG